MLKSSSMKIDRRGFLVASSSAWVLARTGISAAESAQPFETSVPLSIEAIEGRDVTVYIPLTTVITAYPLLTPLSSNTWASRWRRRYVYLWLNWMNNARVPRNHSVQCARWLLKNQQIERGRSYLNVINPTSNNRVRRDYPFLHRCGGGAIREVVRAKGQRLVRQATVADWKQLQSGECDQSAGDVAG